MLGGAVVWQAGGEPPPEGTPRVDPERPRRAGLARTRRPLDRHRCAAYGAGWGKRAVLRRLRPDGAEPAHGQPGAAGHGPPPPGRRPHALRPRGRCHRHDRRSQGLRRAHPQQPRHRQGLDRAGAHPGLGVRLLRGDERRHGGQQLRLDGVAVGHRLPPRHRQALPGQPDAGAGHRQASPRLGDQLHRVLLRAASVHGLPGAQPRPRRDSPVRRVRPVGQHHRRCRAHPAGHRQPGARLRHAAGHQGRRHQVRQDRGRRPVARPADDVAVRLPPVLAQRGGREGRRDAAHLHLPLPRGDRGRSRSRPPTSRGSGRPSAASPTR